MGAHHAMSVITTWRHLPDQPRMILVYMALRIPDAHEDPQWWGGHDSLIEFGMGKDLPVDPGHKAKCGCGICKRRRSLHETCRRQIKFLVKVGALEPLARGYRGSAARYRVLLSQPDVGAISQPDVGTSQRDVGQSPNLTLGPRRHEEKQEERGGGSNSPEATTSPAAADEYAKASKILAQLPDLGATHLAQVDHIDNLTQRVIAAARLARAAPVPSQGGPPAR